MSNPDLVQYIAEQASQAGKVSAKKMFGDYCLYCDVQALLAMIPELDTLIDGLSVKVNKADQHFIGPHHDRSQGRSFFCILIISIIAVPVRPPNGMGGVDGAEKGGRREEHKPEQSDTI